MRINYLYRLSPKFYTKVMYIIFAYGIRFIYMLLNLQKGILIYTGVNEGDSLTRIFYKFKRCICIEGNPNLCKKLKKLFYFKSLPFLCFQVDREILVYRLAIQSVYEYL